MFEHLSKILPPNWEVIKTSLPGMSDILLVQRNDTEHLQYVITIENEKMIKTWLVGDDEMTQMAFILSVQFDVPTTVLHLIEIGADL